jgi:hypothetical protein
MYVNVSGSSACVLMPCGFFLGCDLVIPICDVSYDSYDELKEHLPGRFGAILAVAGKIKSVNNPRLRHSTRYWKKLKTSPAFHFGGVVLKKAIRGKLSLVNIVGDINGLSKEMLPIGSEKIA